MPYKLLNVILKFFAVSFCVVFRLLPFCPLNVTTPMIVNDASNVALILDNAIEVSLEVIQVC